MLQRPQSTADHSQFVMTPDAFKDARKLTKQPAADALRSPTLRDALKQLPQDLYNLLTGSK